ncbi:MAG: pyrimidine 5'-nucleotidase [Chloroflexi bacterium HGW-Chloroflexi-10]|nr:MAG: pyrimidine 5'-nucleotidase [Chloroflexi bacterium HGW-Chloroflexi-10]
MNITTIIFDLDDTLYSPDTGIWNLIRDRIDSYMQIKLGYPSDKVSYMRETYFKKYGTTLRGLQTEHHIDAADYLEYVHDIPVNKILQKNQVLIEILSKIPQRKVIFTNSDRWHTQRVLSTLGIDQFFTQIIDILDISPYCKPMPEAFEIALNNFCITKLDECLMIDDSYRNIKAAQSMGLSTIWVSSQNNQDPEKDLIRINNILELDPLLVY